MEICPTGEAWSSVWFDGGDAGRPRSGEAVAAGLSDGPRRVLKCWSSSVGRRSDVADTDQYQISTLPDVGEPFWATPVCARCSHPPGHAHYRDCRWWSSASARTAPRVYQASPPAAGRPGPPRLYGDAMPVPRTISGITGFCRGIRAKVGHDHTKRCHATAVTAPLRPTSVGDAMPISRQPPRRRPEHDGPAADDHVLGSSPAVLSTESPKPHARRDDGSASWTRRQGV